MVAQDICYFKLATFNPHEVSDVVCGSHRVARPYNWLVLGRRLAQVVVRGVQSRAVECLAQTWVVIVGALEVPVVRICGIFPEHALAGQRRIFLVGVHHCVRVVVARYERFI